jgi:hypothetical protein
MSAVVHRPGEGELIAGPSSVTIKATAEDTGGSFYLGEVLIQPGFALRRRTFTSGSTTCSTSSRGR